MTTLNVHLTSALRSQLEQPGVWAQVVYFQGGQAHWATLIQDGNALGDTIAVDLPTSLNSGKVYLLVQSAQAGAQQSPLQAVIQQESDINIGNATTNNIRFDSIELTYGISDADQGNLSSVIGFGLPMEMAVNYTNGAPTQTVGYAITAHDLFQKIQHIHPDAQDLVLNFTAGALAGEPRFAVAPVSAGEVGVPPFSADDWKPYLETLAGQGGVLAELAGIFNGSYDANNIWHNQGFYHYTLTYEDDAFWLNPTANSQIKGYARITLDELANSIYATNGTAQIFSQRTDSTPYAIVDPITGQSTTNMNVGANNQWGKLFTELVTGLSAGYLGGTTGTPLNAEDFIRVDLSQNWNWDPTYAFGNQVENKPSHWHVDPYAQIFFDYTNSYGSMYSDNLMDGYAVGGPLVSTGHLASIDLTLFADTETPTGYSQPVIYNYLPPITSNALYNAAGTNYSNINIGLNMALPTDAAGGTSWIIDDSKARIVIEVLDQYDAAGTAQWKSITLDSTVGNGELFGNWSLNYDAATGEFAPVLAASGDSFEGQVVLTGLPVADTGVGWYRVTVSDQQGDASKTFNLYTTTEGGLFVLDAASQAIDGGASIALPDQPGSTANTFAINLLSGSSTAIHPSLLIPGGSNSGTPTAGTPAAVVVGRLNSEHADFIALSGQDTLTGGEVHATAGTDDQVLLSFGWTGLNDAEQTAEWVFGYTNKVGALDIVRIDFQQGDTHTYITTQADIDGQWQTPGHMFAEGVYSVTMTSYQASDTNFKHPMTQASYDVELHVDHLGDFPEGGRVALAQGSLALDTGVGEVTGVVYRLYQSALDRAPDPTGLGYWVGEADAGRLDFSGLATAFLASHEFQQQHGSAYGMSDAEFVHLLYEHLFARDAEDAGLAYWVDELEAGASRADVMLAIAESDESITTFQGGVAHGVWFA